MTKRKYTFEQRLEVVMHYFATDDGYRITSARFNVPRTQVRMWVAAYDATGSSHGKPSKLPTIPTDTTTDEAASERACQALAMSRDD